MITIKIRDNAIQVARIKKGLSLRNLAEQSGVNYVTISKLENGKTKPNPNTASKICKALETQFDVLFKIVGCNESEVLEAI